MFTMQSKNSFIRSPFTTLILTVLVAIVLVSFVSILRKQFITEKNKQTALLEQQKFEQQKQLLEKETEHLNTSFGVEQVLREKFGVIKAGEQAVVIVEKKESVENDDLTKQRRKGVLGIILDLF